MKHEIISKAYAYQILRKAFPLKNGDNITFEICEALLILHYKGNSYSCEINEFIKNLKDKG